MPFGWTPNKQISCLVGDMTTVIYVTDDVRPGGVGPASHVVEPGPAPRFHARRLRLP